jgi:phage FluMu protein Com
VIELRCSSCETLLRVPAANAGQKGKCPHCSAVVQVPVPPAAAGRPQPAAAAGSRSAEAAPSAEGPPIQFQCSSCQKLVRTPRAAAGKKGKCPHCGGVVHIPAASSSEPSAAQPGAAAPLSAWEGESEDDLFADLPAAEGQVPLEAGLLGDLSAGAPAGWSAAPAAKRATPRRKPRRSTKDHGPRNGLPWDRRYYEGKFWATTSTVLFSPNKAFSIMSREGGVGKPLGFAVGGHVLGTAALVGYWALVQVGVFVIGMIQASQAQDFAVGDVVKAVGLLALGIGVVLIIAAAGAAAAAIIGSFVAAALHHLALMMMDAADFGFETTYRVIAYCQGAMGVLYVIPVLGPLLPVVAYPVIAILGLCAAQETTVGRAAAAVLIPIALCCAVSFGVSLLLGGVVAAAIEWGEAAAARGM